MICVSTDMPPAHRPMSRIRWACTLLVLCLSTLWTLRTLNSRLRDLEPPVIALPDDLQQAMDATAAKILSFGHTASLVDALTIKGLSDPALDPVPQGTRASLYYLMDLATKLDPYQFELYWMTGNLLSIIRSDGKGTDLILERAHQLLLAGEFPAPDFAGKYWKSAALIEMMRGYNALFELQDFQKAQESFELASRLPGALTVFASLSQRLQTRDGRIQVAERVLSSLLRQKNEPSVRQELEKRAREVQLARFLFTIEEKFLASKMSSFESFLASRKIVEAPEGGKLSWNSQRKRIETSTPLTGLTRLY
jgi:hypothetical protein